MDRPMDTSNLDCIVIGGGPAGLTAAIYLARFHLSAGVLDDGCSRADLIPLTRNHAGHPDGIPGRELRRLMRQQAQSFGVRMIDARAEDVVRDGGRFHVGFAGGAVRAEKVLLATGVHNLRPAMPGGAHDAALARGLIRYCPVCDGFEVTDRRVAVLGAGDHGVREAEFLRSFSADVTLVLPHGAHDVTPAHNGRLAASGIGRANGPVQAITMEDHCIALALAGGVLRFDTLYVALGTEVRAELARSAGAETAADGGVLVDQHQMTSVEGLYAAGDVVKGLDQIAVAMGQAAIAATAMRNAICARRPLRR